MLPEDDCWAMIMQCLKDEPAALCRCSEDLQGAPARRACAAAVTSGQGRRNNAFPLWKLSYFEAEWDSIRTNITIEEVTSHLWRFRFLHYPSPSFVVRYNPDFTYDSCMCVRECERERARQREMCMVWVRMCMVWVCCRVVMCQACVRISVHAGRQVCAYVCG
eukprot:Tamp_27396.p1 GENE.Tamp_27396~~Tamp_27396.p1  ORF type:complete len:177 (-),score=25.19 Tamp_27396:326-814(-)